VGGASEEEAENDIEGRRRRVIAICEGGSHGQAKEYDRCDLFRIKQ
jgi:hypothetical protein